MKICYVADGGSVHTQRWLNYFAAEGHEVHLICWKAKAGYDSNINIHYLKRVAPKLWALSQYPSFISWCIQVRRLINVIHPDVVDAHFITTYGFIAANAGFHPLVVTAWGSDILIAPKHNPIFNLTTRYALKKADQIVCTAPVVQKEISRLGNNLQKTSVIIIGGIDKQKFHIAERDVDLLKRLGIGPHEHVIISTRALAPIYNIETLIKAVPLILSESPDTKFIIVGKGTKENDIRKMASDSGVGNNIVFTGWIEHDLLSSYLSSADIYVSTSLSDGTSNSLLEAMACRVAPVVSDIPSNREWIKDNQNGILFPARDHIFLAKKIISLLNNAELRRAFSCRNKDIIEAKADPEAEMQKLEKLYVKLVQAESS